MSIRALSETETSAVAGGYVLAAYIAAELAANRAAAQADAAAAAARAAQDHRRAALSVIQRFLSLMRML
ncbi:MAG: hypothetical protein AB7O57_13770 [Hyphomicrobiaceae bacterium]